MFMTVPFPLGNQKSDIPDAFDNSNYEQFYACYMK